MINLLNKTVIIRDGRRLKIVSQDGIKIQLSNGYIGNLEIAIKNGYFTFEDADVQYQVLAFLGKQNELNKLILEQGDIKALDDRIAEIACSLWVGNCQKHNISNIHVGAHFSVLEYGKAYGTTAKTIYENCCKNVGFRWDKAGSFAKQQLLFSLNATKEGYCVWMIPRSNLNNSTNGNIMNILEGDTIYEYWTKAGDNYNEDNRVVFIKQDDGQYVFIGVYQLTENKVIDVRKSNCRFKFRKVLKRISNDYQ